MTTYLAISTPTQGMYRDRVVTIELLLYVIPCNTLWYASERCRIGLLPFIYDVIRIFHTIQAVLHIWITPRGSIIITASYKGMAIIIHRCKTH